MKTQRRRLALAACVATTFNLMSAADGQLLAAPKSAAPRAADDADLDTLKRLLIAHQRKSLAEEERLRARIRAKTQRQSAQGMFARAAAKFNRIHGYEEEVQTPKPPKENRCEPQRLYIRADSLDNFLYKDETPPSKVKGASISYTNDREAAQRTLSINGTVSYVLFRDLCPDSPAPGASFVSGWAIVPWISGNGDLTQPQSKKEQSVAKVGVEAQVEISRGLPFLDDFPLRQVFTVSPYYLTDFRGIARASGVSMFWDAYDARVHLGGYLPSNPYFGWFLQLRAEADIRSVAEPGLTGLTATSYAWIGGTARLSMFFLPFADVPDFIRNRLSLILSADYFHDARSRIDIHKYTATLKYKLNQEGTSAVAFEYSKGTDKDSLVPADKYMVKLVFAQ